MCFPLFHFQSLILLPSHHTSEVDEALAVWFSSLFAQAAISNSPVLLLAADVTSRQVKDVVFRSPTSASINRMSEWNNASLTGLIWGQQFIISGCFKGISKDRGRIKIQIRSSF